MDGFHRLHRHQGDHSIPEWRDRIRTHYVWNIMGEWQIS